MNTVYFMENHKEPKPTEQDTAHEPIMTNRENKIYNMVHTWCDEQAQDIPDQNRRYLMDAIVGMIDPQQDEPSEGIEVANTDLKKAIEDVRYLQPMINSFLTMGEQDSLNTVIEAAEKSQWISVGDKLPPEENSVLTYTEKGEIHVGKNRGSFWIIGNQFSFDMGEPTHWMPLPETPKK